MRVALLLAPLGAGLAIAAPVHAAPGTITTVAGGGDGGDGIAATSSALRKPRRIALLPGGGFLVAEFGGAVTYGDGRIRKVDPGGTITTVAGTGIEGFSGDGGSAVDAQMNGPTDILLTPDGGFLVADEFNHRIRRVSAGGAISTVAGSGAEGCGPQSGLAVNAAMTWPRSIAMESGGTSYLLLDENCSRVHRVSAGVDGAIGTADDTIALVAGVGGNGFSGDGGQATAAKLHDPRGIAALPSGAFLIADSLNARIRRVGTNGVITTVAGTGANAFGVDGDYAVNTPLSVPRDVEAAPGGGFLIAESGSHRIRWVAPNGVITTIAGSGFAGTSGDGGSATSAKIYEPHGVNVSPGGDVYISGPGLLDTAATNFRVRRVEGPLPAPPPLPPDPDPDPDPDPTPDPPAPPLPPVSPATVEAPPAPGTTATPPAVAPSLLPAPLRLRIALPGRHRVKRGARLRFRLKANVRPLGRRVTVQSARRIVVRGRALYRYRAVSIARPERRVTSVRVRVRKTGIQRFRIAWSDRGRRRHSAAITVVATPRVPAPRSRKGIR